MTLTEDQKAAFKTGVKASREGAEAFHRERQIAAIHSKGDRVRQTRAHQSFATFKWIYFNGRHPEHRSISDYEDKGFALGVTVLFFVPLVTLVIGLLLSN
jgi:hypothetical protein